MLIKNKIIINKRACKKMKIMKTNFKIRIKYETNKKCKQKDKSTQKNLTVFTCKIHCNRFPRSEAFPATHTVRMIYRIF